VPMATIDRRPEPARFLAGAAAVTLGLFGFFALGWTTTWLVLPLTRFQGHAAAALFGAPSVAVEVTLACSGTDAIALCLGAVLAYPARWRRRLIAATVGVALILILNIVRIGTLGIAAGSPALFNTLHVYVWPAILTLAIAGYVFAWMRIADRRPAESAIVVGPRGRRFALMTVVFVAIGIVLGPMLLAPARVLEATTLVAAAAAWLLRVVGSTAHTSANVLWTPRGAFLVTGECISTPLIPVYLAAICAFAPTWPRMAMGVLAAVPLFAALAILRLLAAALPDVLMTSPAFFIHAFYQLLLAALIVCAAAIWRHARRTAAWHAIAGALAGTLFVYFLGPVYLSAIAPNAAIPAVDPQGALAFLPPFQVGLYVALWIAAFAAISWMRMLAGLAALALTQTAGFVTLHALTLQTGLLPPVPGVRAWAIAGPLVILAGVVSASRAPR
jgi:exosortase/archaeosortase family protein